MSHVPTATVLGVAAAIAVAAALAAPPIGALPVIAAPAEENPAPPRIALDIPPFETVAGRSPWSVEAVVADRSFAAPGSEPGLETGYLLSTQRPHELPAETGVSALPAWSPKDFPSDDPAGPESSQLFAVPVNELLALPSPDRIDAMPEPGLLVLVGSGLVGVALLARYRNRFPRNRARNRPHQGDSA